MSGAIILLPPPVSFRGVDRDNLNFTFIPYEYGEKTVHYQKFRNHSRKRFIDLSALAIPV
jgi:hypothetical protein